MKAKDIIWEDEVKKLLKKDPKIVERYKKIVDIKLNLFFTKFNKDEPNKCNI